MYLLFDIGGTNMRVGWSKDGQSVTATKTSPTPKDFDLGMQILKRIADELRDEQKIEGIALGVAGPLDKEKTMLVASPHISGWNKRPLKAELEKVFNVPVYLENDTALVGLGEATKGAGVGKKIVAYLGIGTGVGGVRIINGKIDANYLGFEPGHQIIVIDGHPCQCGGKGHLETYVAGWYLEKTYQKKAAEISDTAVWDQVAKYLAIGLNNTIVHWSPDIVVLGGSIIQKTPLEALESHLKQALTIFPKPPQLAQATLGDSAGLYGALTFLLSS